MIDLIVDEYRLTNIKGIVFDKDGTLIDSHRYWGQIIQMRSKAIIDYYGINNISTNQLCLKMGYSKEKEILLEDGPIALVSRERVIIAVNEFLKDNDVLCSEEETKKVFIDTHRDFLKVMPNYLRLLPGVLTFLSELKKNKIKTAIVTSDAVENTFVAIKQLNIEHYFDVVIGKETVDADKITGLPMSKAMALLGLYGSETVCIGDAPVDLIMAHKCNCAAGIGVATGQISKDKLKEYSEFVIDSMEYFKVI